MQECSGQRFVGSEQHKTTSNIRIEKDLSDIKKIKEAFKELTPFSDDSSLRNIANGVTANSHVNVDNFMEVGSNIINKLQNTNIFSAKLKKGDKVLNLAHVSHVKTSDNVAISPELLFQRLILGANTDEFDMKNVMLYEMCSFPPSIYETPFLLRKADKASLAKAIKKHFNDVNENCSLVNDTPDCYYYVLDGGSLIHRIPWKKSLTYGEIINSYKDLVLRSYNKCTVVFDGYSNGPSTKDMTHRRRGASGQAVHFTTDMKAIYSKEVFLSNSQNKEKFIRLLGGTLEKAGCKVVYSDSDADTNIVEITILENQDKDVTLIGEDTDLLILLLYKTIVSDYNLLFYSDKTTTTAIDIPKYKEALGTNLCGTLLFLHAFTGCDTTSAIYGHGKTAAFKKMKNNKRLQEIALSLNVQNRSHNQVEELGREALKILCGEKNEKTLSEIRYSHLVDKIVKSQTFVRPEKLPPTESALKFHSYRVYLQIQSWKGNDLLPERWGWKLVDNELAPIPTDLPPAPQELLELIRCKCNGDCSSRACSCRKSGLPCNDACINCDSNCTNSTQLTYNEDDDAD